MKCWMQRNGTGLVPDGTESHIEFGKLPFGKAFFVEIKQPRNPKFHALFWVLVYRVASALGAHPANVCDILKIATNHCEIVKTKRYGEVRLPKSISFASMSETDFREFFERCIQVIQQEWGIDRPDILAATEDLLIGTEQR